MPAIDSRPEALAEREPSTTGRLIRAARRRLAAADPRFDIEDVARVALAFGPIASGWSLLETDRPRPVHGPEAGRRSS